MPKRSYIVGHSSGSFLSTEMLARALKLKPCARPSRTADRAADAGRKFPDRRLPHCVSSNSASICEMLAVEPSIDWIDCQARKDVINF